ncbi:hypothetical protein EII18_12325 [Comamonadaceae bacterium OH3737_COT-264]|nr:hypothetical protein EII18_12325 [Comamonadaceae bacterium OH3737_COT-264]
MASLRSRRCLWHGVDGNWEKRMLFDELPWRGAVVLEARKTWVKNEDAGFLEKWHALGVDLNALACYALVTEATHSAIQIYAMRFMLADIEEDRDARYCQDS